MTVAVLAVTFDHLRGRPDSYTVPLRYNGTVPVLLPEWRIGQRLPSVAAYRIDRLPPMADVLVQLGASPDEPRLQEIRAVAAPAPAACLSMPPLVEGLEPQVAGFGGDGLAGPLAFRFATDSLRAGVGLGTVDWIWQARAGAGEPWRDIAVTSHRLYSLLRAPTAPWRTEPGSPAGPVLPRTDLLDFACAWAWGATTAREVADAVTRAVHGLGGRTFIYDALVGAPHYTLLGAQLLLCDALVERLLGGPGTGPLVNCSDCASIVSTMANLLGADLWQSKMGLVGQGFPLNPVRGIGVADWSRLSGAFVFHEVAWSGDARAEDPVWDACLELDGDRSPARPPHRPVLPAGERFAHEYRDWLAAARGRNLCLPQPSLRMRRPVDPGAAAPLPVLQPQLQAAAAARLKDAGQGHEPSREVMYFDGMFPFASALPDWRMTGGTAARSAAPSPGLSAGTRSSVTRWTARGDRRQAIRIETTETASHRDAAALALRFASEVEHGGLVPWRRGAPGESALMRRDGAFAFFTRGNLICAATTVGPRPAPVLAVLAGLDRWMTAAGVAMEAVAGQVPGGWTRWTFPGDLGAAVDPGLSALGPQVLSSARRHVVMPERIAP